MLQYGLAHKNQRDRQRVASNAAKTRWANYHPEPQSAIKPLPDPLYTLAFTDHIIGKEFVFTLHKGKRHGSFRIDVNGQPFRNGGWSKALEEIRKKRIKIQHWRTL